MIDRSSIAFWIFISLNQVSSVSSSLIHVLISCSTATSIGVSKCGYEHKVNSMSSYMCSYNEFVYISMSSYMYVYVYY